MLYKINDYTGTVCYRCSSEAVEGVCPNCKTGEYCHDESEYFCNECFSTYRSHWNEKICIVCEK